MGTRRPLAGAQGDRSHFPPNGGFKNGVGRSPYRAHPCARQYGNPQSPLGVSSYNPFVRLSARLPPDCLTAFFGNGRRIQAAFRKQRRQAAGLRKHRQAGLLHRRREGAYPGTRQSHRQAHSLPHHPQSSPESRSCSAFSRTFRSLYSGRNSSTTAQKRAEWLCSFVWASSWRTT